MKISVWILAAMILAGAMGNVAMARKQKAVSAKVKKEVVSMTLELSSPAFKSNAPIPARHSCAGADVSPELKWSQPPPGTSSFALVMDDPDAPVGTWVHWVVYNIPAACQGLPESLAKEETLKDGTRQGLCYGVKDFSRVGYWGPCPPSGTHHYVFKLFALDQVLNLKPRSTVFGLQKAMEGHVLAKAELVGTFAR
jgi:Raf kinase inhibitor-like YbhB/YbcL family protein